MHAVDVNAVEQVQGKVTTTLLLVPLLTPMVAMP